MTTVTTTLSPYVRRPAPSTHDAGWFDIEHGAIQRAIASLDGAAILAVTAPLAFDPATQTLSVSSTGPTAARLTADVSTTSTSFTSAGLGIAVTSGTSWSCHWVVWVGTGAGATGGMLVRLAFPAVGSARGLALGDNSGVITAAPQRGASPITLGLFANADYSASDSWLRIDASFDGFTASGTVDLQFAANVGGQQMIVRRDSTVTAVQTN